MKKILFLVGPTASGKSNLALALAKKLKGSIISADSMQVYRDMDIGTAKPSPEDQKRIPHYLIDIVSPSRSFSVYEWRKLALEAIEEILSQGRLPIVAGGSGLYVQALLDGLAEQVPADSGLRKKLALLSLSSLYARLKKADPQSAAKIHPNDKKRIIRALEIYKLSGKTRSEWAKKKESLGDLGFFSQIIGIRYEREALYERIESRIDQMIQEGLVKEVKKLAGKRLSKTARMSLSYREILDYLKGKLSLEEAIAEIKKNTRHFAKRQWTWFRHEKRIRWVDADRKPISRLREEVLATAYGKSRSRLSL